MASDNGEWKRWEKIEGSFSFTTFFPVDVPLY